MLKPKTILIQEQTRDSEATGPVLRIKHGTHAGTLHAADQAVCLRISVLRVQGRVQLPR